MNGFEQINTQKWLILFFINFNDYGNSRVVNKNNFAIFSYSVSHKRFFFTLFQHKRLYFLLWKSSQKEKKNRKIYWFYLYLQIIFSSLKKKLFTDHENIAYITFIWSKKHSSTIDPDVLNISKNLDEKKHLLILQLYLGYFKSKVNINLLKNFHSGENIY